MSLTQTNMNTPRYLFLLVVLGLRTAEAQSTTPTLPLRDSLSAVVRSFRQQVQGLGNPADSAQWLGRQQQLLNRFFASDTVALPNLFVPMPADSGNRPRIAANAWVQQLPRHFWLGFRFEVEEANLTVQRIDTNRQGGGQTATVQVPVSLRGIVARTRQAYRTGEVWAITLQNRPNAATHSAWVITAIEGTARPLFREPLTRKKAQAIRRQLQTLLTQWLSPVSADSLQKKACGQLRSLMLNDTLYWQKTDKETIIVSLRDSLQRPVLSQEQATRLSIQSFGLDYITDIAKAPGGFFIGDRLHLEGVIPEGASDFWYQAMGRGPVPVPDGQAGKGLSYWRGFGIVMRW